MSSDEMREPNTEELEQEKQKIEELMKASDEIVDTVVHMAPFELCKKLATVGVQETYKEAFRALVGDDQYSPQPIVEHWIKAIPKESGPLEKVFLEAAAAKLWDLWLADRPMDRALHFWYQSGYQDQVDEEMDRSFQAWSNLWKELQKRGYQSPTDLPEKLTLAEPPGMHLMLQEWVEDFRRLANEMEKDCPIQVQH
ncbi:MAG: hypothetical protein H6624_08330 [Bdellovibrionaceae bacterium]|nr:hypothetical protein [Bdellovibrionales bacterium]MCB9084338.1 hypothetical protein [Pseudobdellovibrionaceae bacterium]